MSSQTFSEMCEESAVRLYLKQSGLDDDAIDDYLEHHGIKGMKWGQRRWQNEDGSLTAAGREHYSVGQGRKGGQKEAQKLAKLAQKTDQASIPFSKSGRYIGNTRKADRLRKKLLSTPQVRDTINRARDTRAKVAAADTRVDQLTDQFYGNKDGMFKKYQEMALKERLDDFRKELERDGTDESEIQSELKSYEHEFKYGDLDQDATLDKWLDSDEPSAREFAKAMNDRAEARKEYEAEVKSYISEFTGSFGSQPINSFHFNDVNGYLAQFITRYA